MITRRDLPFPHNAVQAIHAALESAYKGPTPSEHPHLVLCEVADEPSLYRELQRLERRGAQMYPFHEPDRDDELTSISSGVITDRRPFRHLKLLKERQS